jgi:predicted transcriptional regulator
VLSTKSAEIKATVGTMHGRHRVDVDPYLELLRSHGKMILLDIPEKPL